MGFNDLYDDMPENIDDLSYKQILSYQKPQSKLEKVGNALKSLGQIGTGLSSFGNPEFANEQMNNIQKMNEPAQEENDSQRKMLFGMKEKSEERKIKEAEKLSDRNFQREIYGKKQDAAAEKGSEKSGNNIAKTLDPTSARSGEFGKIFNTLQAIRRSQALFDNFSKDPNNLSKFNTAELAEVYLRVVSGGGSSSEQRINNLTPQSARGSFEALRGWIINNPKGMEQQAFVKLMREGLERESSVAAKSMNAIKIQRLATPESANYRESNPIEWKRIVKASGLNPDNFNDNMEYVETPEQGITPVAPLGQQQNLSTINQPKSVTQNVTEENKTLAPVGQSETKIWNGKTYIKQGNQWVVQ